MVEYRVDTLQLRLKEITDQKHAAITAGEFDKAAMFREQERTLQDAVFIEDCKYRAHEADALAYTLHRAHCNHAASVLSMIATDVRVLISHLQKANPQLVQSDGDS